MNVRNITLGLYGGLAGGVVFGAMMATMGMLPMIGLMVGLPSAGVTSSTAPFWEPPMFGSRVGAHP